MVYRPEPVDTSDVKLPKDIFALQEQLAKNTHERWAEEKYKEGWSYGEELDHKEKKHPDLIPYEHLSELKKDYDRITSMETLKMIYKLGYAIHRKT